MERDSARAAGSGPQTVDGTPMRSVSGQVVGPGDVPLAGIRVEAPVQVPDAPVLVDSDPQGRTVNGCPDYGPTQKPCTNTLAVEVG